MNAFFSRDRRDRELDEEIQSHLDMAVRERMAHGESREDAERAARREFGDPTRVKEATRSMWGGMWLERLVADIRYGWRGLRRAPGFTTAAVLTLVLGVGANTAVFTVVNGVLLRPLPFAEPERLYLIAYDETNPAFDRPPSMWESTFAELRGSSRAFEGMTSFGQAQHTLTGAGDPVRLPSALVDAAFTAVLGVTPALGRGFAAEEETPGRDQVVLLGDRLWRSRFAGDPAAVGRSVTLDGIPHTVVGVMPPGFDFPYDVELWLPVPETPPGQTFVRPVVGRLKPDATLDAAKEEIARVGSASAPSFIREPVASVVPLLDFIAGDVERSLLVFAGAVGFVLLIACANVANLLLVRAAERQHEVVVRAALGAGRARIVRQLLTESLMVALLGGLGGVLLSVWGVELLLAMAPDGLIPRTEDVRLDGAVLAVSLGATVLAGLGFGLAPALSLTRGLWDGLGDGLRTLGGVHARLRRGLVVAEIALSIVLLIGAGLLVRSFSQMRAVDLGFRPEQVLAMSLDLPERDYPDAQRLAEFNTALLGDLGALPGVEAAGSISWAPLIPNMLMGTFQVEGIADMPPGSILDKMATTPGYFRALGIDLLHGREFTTQDDTNAPGAVMISRSVAERFWPPDGAAAVGKRLTGEDRPTEADWLTIVGVVEDVGQVGLTEERHAAMYTPVLQTTRTFFLSSMTYLVRTRLPEQQTMQAMRDAVTSLDANLPITSIRTMDQLVSSSISAPRFEATLLATFSIMALLLAAIGTYGVLAYDVASRTQEIGLRMALGATGGELVGSTVLRAATLAGAGVALGLAAALGFSRILEDSLYEVTRTDPTTFAVVTIGLFVVAILAAAVPARRAAGVDPLRLLRRE
jgi:predicted permease